MNKFFLLTVLLSGAVLAQNDYGYLKPGDQKYFKNDSFEGNNKLERIDLNVKEINKLHSEVAVLKSEIQLMKKEIEELKTKK